MALFNYESEQIFEKVHGDNAPQGKHFVSDCKQELLNGLTPNYPQLTDYEQEWLYFGDKVFVEGQPVNLEYATFEGTKGQIDNAIPFNYKRASLKGLTLVNLFNIDNSLLHEPLNKRWKYTEFITSIKGGETYYIYFSNKLNNLPLHIKPLNESGESGTTTIQANTGIVKTLDTGVSEIGAYYYYKDGWTGNENRDDILNNCKIILIKYQEGIENWNISYFEGMKSFDNHLVTTTGKNLFDINSLSEVTYGINNYSVHGNTVSGNPINAFEGFGSLYIPVKKGISYTISCLINKNTSARIEIRQYNDMSDTSINSALQTTTTNNHVTITAIGNIIKLTLSNSTQIEYTEISNIQVEENTTATPYEPYYDVEGYLPVLSTSGKNLFDKSFMLGNIDGNGNVVQSTSNIISNPIKVKGNTTYSISGVDEYIKNKKLYYIEYDENMTLIKTGTITPFTTSSNGMYVRIQINASTNIENANSLLQIEEGTTPTPYEPYQQHQVRINEDITLRSVGDVYDELNLLTGELTERIGEVVLNGKESWRMNDDGYPNTISFICQSYSGMQDKTSYYLMNSDRFKSGEKTEDSEIIDNVTSNFCYIRILRNKLNTQDVSGFKSWLQSNPVTVQYKLATETVKTVDVNTPSPYEGTNYYTSTAPVVLECPVVSTGAKTLNEISQEE